MDLERLGKHNRGEDIINVRDDILSHILSHLSTKDAFKTCVLSSRWKNLWTSIYNLRFEYWGGEYCKRYSFMSFVDRVLSLYQSKDIQEFHLDFHYLETDDLSRGVEIEESWRPCCCPVHEDLSIYGSDLDAAASATPDLDINDYLLTFDICVPTLKKLSICHLLDYNNLEGVSKLEFVITARNLEYLYIQDSSLASITVNERPSLHEVSLEVGVDRFLVDELGGLQVSQDEANGGMELLKGISSNTELLSLTFLTMEALSLAFNDNMPCFPSLIHLELGIEACFGWKLLPKFLNNSPNLEELVPTKMENVKGEDDELEVVSYMLRNCVVLEEFYVDIVDSESKPDLQKQILMYPRGSVSCKIEFL
ncbi:hypothetical protein Dsin_016951 [Dipteronia sinensis]|uniref:FBD domain-containing protein n=1 Tax=Dipteronia sinensis TaxID=43782 RepID=A0AAE0AFI0_9ROSI|nr:hypothetical protein Dsin_016951 [Dipteronia sinensis]